MTRRRSDLEQFRRTLYKSQRLIGDVQSAQRGRLAKRLVRRSLMRALFRAMR